jgi:F-type H+-transporting ATPase subunit epsilon
MADLKVNIVTPETTVYDQVVQSVTIPLIDGEAGILPDHSPMIGRLAAGELRVQAGGRTERFYVDGGTVQVLGNLVSVLTGRCVLAGQVNVVAAREALAQAEKMPGGNTKLNELRTRAIKQAQAQIRIAEKA